ncbi:MAG: T9SS type A sorting domain-containing protein [Bacteroidota bacterium]
MKKNFTNFHVWAVLFLFSMGSMSVIFAQVKPIPSVQPAEFSGKIHQRKSDVSNFPSINSLEGDMPGGITPWQGTPTPPSILALWDSVLSVDLGNQISGLNAPFGVGYLNDEIWISQLGTNNIHVLDKSGSFVETFQLAGLTGSIFSFTTDGTSIYATTNSTSIIEINPTTRTITSTINTDLPCLWASYDPNINGGNGGFWTSFFLQRAATEIILYDMDGNLTAIFSPTNHKLSGILGGAIDNTSPGGPYLWVSVLDFNSTPANAFIRQIELSTGRSTAVFRDLGEDLGVTNEEVGGIFIANDFNTGQDVLLTIASEASAGDFLQGYDFDFTPPAEELSVEARMTEGLFLIPQDQVTSINSTAIVANYGTDSIDGGAFALTAIDENSFIISTDTTALGDFAPRDTTVFLDTLNNPITPGGYGLISEALINGDIADDLPSNNLAFYQYGVSDSTLGRDDFVSFRFVDDVPIGNGEIAGQNFPLFKQDGLTSLSLLILPDDEVLGAPIFGFVYSVDSVTGTPQTLIASTFPYIVSQDDIDRTENNFATSITLPFANSPIDLPVDEVFVGVSHQGNGDLDLATRPGVFTPGKTWIFANGQNGPAWSNTEDFFFAGEFVYTIQANFNYCSDLAVDSLAVSPDDGSGNGSAEVTVAGGTPPYSYVWSVGQTSAKAENLSGGDIVLNIFDSRQCVFSTTVTIPLTVSLKDRLSAGILGMEVYPNPSSDLVSIDLELADNLETELQLITPAGQILSSQTFSKRSVLNTEISLKNLASGMYYLKVITPKGVINQLIAKQ